MLLYDLNTASNLPLIYFEAFDSFEPFIEHQPDYKIGTIVKPLITKEEYAEKVTFIKEQIKNGITYEVNYTYPSTLRRKTHLPHPAPSGRKPPVRGARNP